MVTIVVIKLGFFAIGGYLSVNSASVVITMVGISIQYYERQFKFLSLLSPKPLNA